MHHRRLQCLSPLLPIIILLVLHVMVITSLQQGVPGSL
jgi:hypothetical protein